MRFPMLTDYPTIWTRFRESERNLGSRFLQRTFFTYTSGWPGIGLLLLRASVGIALVVQAIALLVSPHNVTFVTSLLSLVLLTIGAALLIGYLTAIAGVLAAGGILASAVILFPTHGVFLFESRLTVAFATVITVAIVCLGPGAFSVDAHLFGRREIIIPGASHPPNAKT